MNAEKFFETEEIPAGSNFDKIPEGMTYIKVDTLDIETTKNNFGESKARFKIKFTNRKGESKSYEVGIQIIRGIEAAIQKKTEFIVLTRQGKGKENTKYTVAALEEN
jgi:hypothetical protein